MGLDNMQGGDKVFYFETNNIIKSIRTLFGLLTNKWRFIGKETITSGNFTAPARANFAIIQVSMTRMSFGTIKGEILLNKKGKDSGIFRGIVSDGVELGVSFTWDGTTITRAYDDNGSIHYDTLSATAYYYQ